MNYRIIICTSGRASSIASMTLAMLEMDGYSFRDVLLIVDPRHWDAYAEALKMTQWRRSMIPGAIGLRAQRNLATELCDEGERVVSLDDDLRGFVRMVDHKTLVPESFRRIAARGFAACARTGARLWGVYPVKNRGWMSGGFTVGVVFCVGWCWGVINDRKIRIDAPDGDKEDYERSIKYAAKFGCNVRLNDVTGNTNMFTEPGGLQGERTRKTRMESTMRMVRLYPAWLSVDGRRLADGRWELRLRDPRKKGK